MICNYKDCNKEASITEEKIENGKKITTHWCNFHGIKNDFNRAQDYLNQATNKKK